MLTKSGKLSWFSPARWNGRLSITVTLATAISLLVLVSVGSVLGVGIWLAGKNTLALMSANANRSIANTADRIEQHLLPAEEQSRFIAERIERGEIDPGDRRTFGRLLTGALAGVPQIESISFFDTDLKSFYAARREGRRLELGELDHSDDPRFRNYLANMPKLWDPDSFRHRPEATPSRAGPEKSTFSNSSPERARRRAAQLSAESAGWHRLDLRLCPGLDDVSIERRASGRVQDNV